MPDSFIEIVTVAALAFAPGLFWLWYFYRRNTCEPEPRGRMIRVFTLGMLITIPAAFLESIFTFILASPFLLAVLVAPVVEELAKYSSVRYTVYQAGKFNQVIDGIIYAAAAALGFASVENVLYLLLSLSSSTAELITTYAFRTFFSVPAHALISGIWGYALGRAYYTVPQQRGIIIASGVVLAIALHGIFNLLAGLELFIGLIVLLVVYTPILWYVANRNIIQAVKACIPPRLRRVR